MAIKRPKTTYLKDYTPPSYHIPTIDLRFEIGKDSTVVYSRIQVVRTANIKDGTPLLLDGQHIELMALFLDGRHILEDNTTYQIGEDNLILFNPPKSFTLMIITKIRPQNNTSLEGLYQSGKTFCTQCEAKGFRKITYFLDRPDVMTVFTTTIVADESDCPVLLSNGHRIDSGVLKNGRHWATWHDPFPKPCYLFAIVAGQLGRVEDVFITSSGRKISLYIYVESEKLDQCGHAMYSLKQAMAWDERRFGLEYDLDLYQIVAISDFNMGAMENKGLNIFNTKYVLAKPETATDTDYQGILGVIGHEYFHNWTGNRVTCRDWFQLSLKEGLTVFRDQEFASDLYSAAVKRIEDVRVLRATQFLQDAGPMAHPVRPDSYIEINNLYTVTVYNKGAEVVRMIQTLLGREGFRQGMNLYFQRHDGKAVTCDDFLDAMGDANNVDLGQFKFWYHQSGTPEVHVTDNYNPDLHLYSLNLRQFCSSAPDQPDKGPFHIPLTLGLIDPEGNDLPLQLYGEDKPGDTTRLFALHEQEHTFHFINIPKRPVLSMLRGFSAPVKLVTTESDADLQFRLAYDSDSFNRWDASQTLAIRAILALISDSYQGQAYELSESFSDAFEHALVSNSDPALLAQVLTLPSQTYLAEQVDVVDVEGIHSAYTFCRRTLAERLYRRFLEVYRNLHKQQEKGHCRIDAAAVGQRALKNVCLDYLMQIADTGTIALCLDQFYSAANMTDQLGALAAMNNFQGQERTEVLTDFYSSWREDALVVDKWLTLQATSSLPEILVVVKSLLAHEAFNIGNPNKVRALIGAFCQSNPLHFHAADGSGYVFLTDQVLMLNALNPLIAARLMNAFTRWNKFDLARQNKMCGQLQRILATENLSPEIYEITAKSLGN